MANLIGNVQEKFKTSSNLIALTGFKVLTGFFVGLTLALIGDQIIDYGMFSFLLVIITTIGLVMRISRPWNWTHMVIFNLFCVLTGLLLRMYILIAPG